MLNQKSGFKRALLMICLVVNILVLLRSFIGVGAAGSSTYHPSAYSVVNGTYLSGSLPSSLQNVDSDYFAVVSLPSAVSVSTYYPSGYSLFGGTTYVSGTMGDLASNDGMHQVYRSFASAMSSLSLYAHQETATVSGNSYYLQKAENVDSAGAGLSASMSATGRNLMGRFIYPLTGIGSIPASDWTGFYRAWRDPDQSIAYDSVGSGNNGDGSTSISWSHVVGSGFNRFMMIGVSIRTVTVSVSSVTVGSRSATLLRNDTRGTGVRGEIWYLVNPDSGLQTVTVTLSDISKASGGSVGYTGVDQASPIDNHSANVSSTGYPSISLTTTIANAQIFSNLAISGTYLVSAHGLGQTHRYYEIGTGGSVGSRAGDDGDDMVATTAGAYTLSWNMTFISDVVAQAVAIRTAPPPVGHVDVDISILKSDGTIRTSIATNVSDSADLTPSATTLSGTYSWATYTVVNQTDFLEIDYYVDVASTFGLSAYLRIDDNTLPIGDQTRMTNVMLPSEHTVEVELAGTCNTYNWNQLLWTADSAWTTDSAAVTVQLYSYGLGAYSTVGDGFVSYVSNATANTDEEKTQVIVVNSNQFTDASGNWRIKIKGVKTTNTPFDFRVDWLEFRPTYYSEYTVSTEFQFSSMTVATPERLNFSIASEYGTAGVPVIVQVWNYLSSDYATSGDGYLAYTSLGASETQQLSIDTDQQSYVSNGEAKIRVTAVFSTTAQFQQRIDQASLVYAFAGVAWQPFDWTLLLYVLPVPFVLCFVWLGFRRRKKNSFTGKGTDSFSDQFGMTHEQMTGKKILLEIDPTSDYNLAFSSFVSEAKNNDESLYIVTNRNSALHSVFSEDAKVNFLLLTPEVQYRQQISEREIHLPESDLSVVLSTFNGIQRATAGEESISVFFDNISDVIAKCGFDETHEFIRGLLEAISSENTTAVFAFTPSVHDQEVASSIRELFQAHLAYSNSGARIMSL